jgi:ribokinase
LTPGRAPAAGRGHVLVVGSVNFDFVVRAARLPRPGETVTGGEFTRHHGGKGANQAVAAARMGAHVAFVGAVGQDELGGSAIVELESEGIDTTGIARLPDVPTGVALIVVDADGENQIAVASGANGALDGAAVESALDALEIAEDAVLLANLEIFDEALMSGAGFARRRGWRIVVNPAPARSLPPELLAMGPLLLPNAGEAEQLTGLADPAAAARALGDRTGAPVAVTLGSEGALLVEGDELTRLPAPRVDAVDATGAGDTFAGAFAAELAAGADTGRAARVAVAAASLSVTRAGARGGMPTREQVLEALHQTAG